MKKYRGIGIGLVCCVALPIILTIIVSRQTAAPAVQRDANSVPGEITAAEKRISDFSLKDLDGKTVSLKGFKGKYLVINTWASWCPFCVKELPDFAEVARRHKEEVVFIAINRGESKETVQKFLDERGVRKDMVFLLDPDDSFYKSIGGFSMPETIFVDPHGVIREHKRGPLMLQEVDEKVKNLLKQ